MMRWCLMLAWSLIHYENMFRRRRTTIIINSIDKSNRKAKKIFAEKFVVFSPLNSFWNYSREMSLKMNFSSPICRFTLGSIVVLLLWILFYLRIEFNDPTCYKDECFHSIVRSISFSNWFELSLNFVLFQCEEYHRGFLGGQLCPELCTTKTIQIGICLGNHRNSKSRVKSVQIHFRFFCLSFIENLLDWLCSVVSIEWRQRINSMLSIRWQIVESNRIESMDIVFFRRKHFSRWIFVENPKTNPSSFSIDFLFVEIRLRCVYLEDFSSTCWSRWISSTFISFRWF